MLTNDADAVDREDADDNDPVFKLLLATTASCSRSGVGGLHTKVVLLLGGVGEERDDMFEGDEEVTGEVKGGCGGCRCWDDDGDNDEDAGEDDDDRGGRIKVEEEVGSGGLLVLPRSVVESPRLSVEFSTELTGVWKVSSFSIRWMWSGN